MIYSSQEFFLKILKALSVKNPKKYNFILKAGQSVKNLIFNLFGNVWEKESEPNQWKKTQILSKSIKKKVKKMT